jgi:hypothetical protein
VQLQHLLSEHPKKSQQRHAGPNSKHGEHWYR